MSDAHKLAVDADRVIAVRVAGIRRVVEHHYDFKISDVVARPLVARQSVAAAMEEVGKHQAVRRIGLDRETMGQLAAWQAAREAISTSGAKGLVTSELETDFETVYGKLAEVSQANRGKAGALAMRMNELAMHLEDAGTKYRVFVRKIERLRDVRRRQVEALLLGEDEEEMLIEALDECFFNALRTANEIVFGGKVERKD